MNVIAYERRLERQRKDAKKRRARRKAAGTCINAGPRSRITHGPVEIAGRCHYCVQVWRKSK